MIEKVEASGNAHLVAQAYLAYGFAYRYTDPPAAMAAQRRALEVAQQSGNRFIESHIALALSQLESQHGAWRKRWSI